MKKHWIGAALTAMLFSGAVSAQPPVPGPAAWATLAQESNVDQNLLQQFVLLVVAGDAASAYQLIATHPQQFLLVFEAVYQNYPGTQGEERQQSQVVLNYLAEGLARAGNPEPKSRLSQAGTPADVTTTPALQEAQWPLATAGYMLAMGNYRQLAPLLRALQSKLAADDPSTPQVEVLCSTFQILAGDYALALRKGDELVALAEKIPQKETLCELYAALLLAGLKGGQPELLHRHLPGFARAIEGLAAADQPSYRFLEQSYRALWQLKRQPPETLEAALTDHDRLWKTAPNAYPSSSHASCLRCLGEVSKLWLAHLGDQISIHNIAVDSPGDQRLTVSADLQVNAVAGWIKGQPEGTFQQLQAFFLLVLWLAEGHKLYVDLNWLQEARDVQVHLDSVEPELMKWEPQMRQYEKELQAAMPAAWAAALPAGYRISMTAGDWDLCRMLIRRARLRQMLAEKSSRLGAEDTKKALRWSQESITLNQRALVGVAYQAEDDPRWTALELLFRVRPQGWQTRAQELIGELLEVNQQLGYRPGLTRVFTFQGQLQSAQGRNPEAIQSLQKAVDYLESYVTEVGGSQLGSSRIRRQYQGTYDLLTRLQIQAGQGAGAMETLVRKAQMESVSQQQGLLKGDQRLDKAQQLRGESALLEQQIRADQMLGRDTTASEKLLASNKVEFHRVLADLRRDKPNFESALAIRPINFVKLQKYIPTNATVVQYFPTEEQLYIFVVTQSELKIHEVPVKSAELNRQVAQVRQLLAGYPQETELSAHPERFSWKDDGSALYRRHTGPLKSGLGQLYTWLIAPVEKELASREVLAIIPTGNLHYVPYPALCRLDSQGLPVFLAQSRQCVNLVKSSDLSQLAEPGTSQGQQLLALANPDGSLPGAEREVAKIRQAFPSSQVIVGAQATVDKLQMLGKEVRYVHLATHGDISSSDPKRNYLRMAGSGEQGRLKVSDIYGLSWEGVRLVTLSACKTALQAGSPGSEVTNLAEAFSVAGGNSVVASLWSVSDEATEKLMVELYQGLAEGKSLAESLQRAELATLKQPGLGHPFYWAAFTLFGDWR